MSRPHLTTRPHSPPRSTFGSDTTLSTSHDLPTRAEVSPALVEHLVLLGRGQDVTGGPEVADELRALGAGLGRVLTEPWQRTAQALGAPVGVARHLRRLPDGRRQVADVHVGAGVTVVVVRGAGSIAIETAPGGDALPLLVAARMGLLAADPDAHADIEHEVTVRWADGAGGTSTMSLAATHEDGTWSVTRRGEAAGETMHLDDAGALFRLLHLLLPPLPRPDEPGRPQQVLIPGTGASMVLPAGWVRRRSTAPSDPAAVRAGRAGHRPGRVAFGPGRAAVELEPALARAELTVTALDPDAGIPSLDARIPSPEHAGIEGGTSTLTDHTGHDRLAVATDADGRGFVSWTITLTPRPDRVEVAVGSGPRPPALTLTLRLPPVAVLDHLDAAMAAVRTLRLAPPPSVRRPPPPCPNGAARGEPSRTPPPGDSAARRPDPAGDPARRGTPR